MTALTGSAADVWRVALVAAAVFYLPGVPLARRFARAAGGATGAWLLPSALIVLLPAVWMVTLAHGNLTAAAAVVETLTVAGAVWGGIEWARTRRSVVPRLGPRAAAEVRPLEWAVIVLCAGVLAWSGGPLHLSYDSLDHLTQLRRALLSGQILPRDEFYRGGDGVGWDSRKGFLHPLESVICLLAAADPLALWRVLPAVLAPGLVLIWSRVMRSWCGPGTRSDVALVVWLLVGFGSGLTWLTRTCYPNHVGYALAFLAVALWCDQLARAPRRGRLVAIAALLFAAELIHLVPAFLACFAMGAGGLAQLLGSRGSRKLFGRTLAAVGAAVIGAIVPVVWRLLVQGPAVSTLHTHPQGLLLLSAHLFTASPVNALAECGLAGVVAIPLVFLAAGAARPALRAPLVGMTLLPWLIVGTPVFSVLYPALGYLLVRFLLVIPAAVVLTLTLDAARQALAARRRGPYAAQIMAGAVLALLVLLPALKGVPAAIRGARDSAQGADTPLPFASALQVLRSTVSATPTRPPVVLADPFTSYAITAVSGAHVVSTLNQHGPPTDARWAARLNAQRDMLEAASGVAGADSLLAAYGVDYVFLNRALSLPEIAFGSQTDSVTIARAMRRFAAEPARFAEVYRGADGVIYRVRSGAGESAAPEAAPTLSALPVADGVEHALTFPGVRAAVVVPATLQRGATTRLVVRWQRTAVLTDPLPLWVHVRADRPVPRRWFSGAAWSKVARRLIEHQDGVRYRFRTDALPLHGMRTLAALPLGAAVWDTLDITVPWQAGPGRYALKLALVAEPFVENLRLRDILRDDDLYNGVVIDSIVVH